MKKLTIATLLAAAFVLSACDNAGNGRGTDNLTTPTPTPSMGTMGGDSSTAPGTTGANPGATGTGGGGTGAGGTGAGGGTGTTTP